jgi:hypothetical protein
MDILEQDIDGFLAYLKRPTVMNKRNAAKLIGDLDAAIELLDQKRKAASTRMQKNQIYSQIANRQSQICWAAQFL